MRSTRPRPIDVAFKFNPKSVQQECERERRVPPGGPRPSCGADAADTRRRTPFSNFQGKNAGQRAAGVRELLTQAFSGQRTAGVREVLTQAFSIDMAFFSKPSEDDPLLKTEAGERAPEAASKKRPALKTVLGGVGICFAFALGAAAVVDRVVVSGNPTEISLSMTGTTNTVNDWYNNPLYFSMGANQNYYARRRTRRRTPSDSSRMTNSS